MSTKNPSTSNGGDLKRMKLDFVNKSKKFLFEKSDYSKQFAHIYSFRLKEMTTLLEQKVRQKWGKHIPIKKLCDLREDIPENCIIIGTIFKHQQYKPSILREISEENQLAPQPPRNYYVNDNDKLILEDELQRIRLLGKIDVHQLVTGIVCAVKGYVEGDGKFSVDDYLFYESGPQKPLKTLNESPLLVLISGLDMTSSHLYTESLESLKKWLSGNFDDYKEANDFKSSSISRIVLAGNSIRSQPEVKQKNLLSRKAEYPDTVKMVENLDKWFSEWVKNDINVDIMPGEHDPANFMLPQQPLHSCMFPKAKQNKSFTNVTNPYIFEMSDRLVVGTSGQNINDIMRTSKIEDPLEALRCTIKWSHIAPTCPDTLACYPYVEKDPFIIAECPHVAFIGNFDEFKSELYEGVDEKKTRLVCVPSFVKTQSIAVVDLNTLDCREISFKLKAE